MAVVFITGKDRYDKVIARVARVKKRLRTETACIKDMQVKPGNPTL